MRIITILPDLELTELDGTLLKDKDGSPVTIKHIKFLLDRLSDAVFTENFEGLARGIGIRKMLLSYDNSGLIKLEDQDWDKMCTACRHNYNPQIAHNLITLIEAVLNAKKDE